MGAEREGFDDIRAAAEAAIGHYGHAASLFKNTLKNPDWRHGVIELSAAVVGENNTILANLAGPGGVGGGENTFDHKRSLPDLTHQLDVPQRSPSCAAMPSTLRENRPGPPHGSRSTIFGMPRFKNVRSSTPRPARMGSDVK